MARFLGEVQGARGEATRLGAATSGLRVEAKSWQGKIVVSLAAYGDVDQVWIGAERHGSSNNPTGVVFSGTFDELKLAIEMFARRHEVAAYLALTATS